MAELRTRELRLVRKPGGDDPAVKGPAVKDPAVIGVRNTRWGEVPRAIVVTAPGGRVSAEDAPGSRGPRRQAAAGPRTRVGGLFAARARGQPFRNVAGSWLSPSPAPDRPVNTTGEHDR